MEETRAKRQAVWTTKACDICGESENVTTLGTRAYQVPTRHYIFEIIMNDVVCESCGFVFARQVPDDAFLFDYYMDAHTLGSEYQNIEPDFDVNARLKLVQEHLPEGTSVLEIGAHAGDFCETLSNHGYYAIGLDPLDSDTKDVVLQTFVAGNVQVANLALQESFDAVISYYVLEHVINARAWLSEAKAYLKDEGILIIEVPNFGHWPAESLNHEHFLHLTPFHLEKLLANAGFEKLADETTRASRYFGFVLVGRLRDKGAVGNTASRLMLSDLERSRLVELSKQKYCDAQESRDREDRRTRALANELWARIRALQPKDIKVYFWAANQYATNIALKLAEGDQVETFIVDNSATKIGTPHEGFERSICAPVFETRDASHRIFVLCSPAWNWQISNQIQEMALEDITIIDGSI